jgi:hypothetical protein
MTCEQVCVLVDVDEGNNERVCNDVLDMEKIVTQAMLEREIYSWPQNYLYI